MYAPTVLLALDGLVLLGSLVRVNRLIRRYPELETNAKYMSLHLVFLILFTASNALYTMSFFVKSSSLMFWFNVIYAVISFLVALLMALIMM